MADNEYMRTIEINGIKMEIDLRTARKIDTFKVGDNVKVLRKRSDKESEILCGVITDFCEFKSQPTIAVAVFKEGNYYSEPNIEFIYINEKLQESDDRVEIIKASDDELIVTRTRLVDRFEKEIESRYNKYLDLKNKLDYFNQHFGAVCKSEEDKKDDTPFK